MVSKVYYSPNMNNEYKLIKTTPPQMKNDWNKISSLTFETNKDLRAGGHIIYETSNYSKFGGQIVDIGKGYHKLNSYTVLDYRKYLKTEVNYSPLGFYRSSDIVANLLNKYAVYNNSPIKLNISPTPPKKGFYKLVWEKKSLLSIINELIYLEYLNKTLIYCNIDFRGMLTYMTLPPTMNIPVIRKAIDGSYNIDYTDIKTVLQVDNKNTKKNIELAKIFGNMNILVNTKDEPKSYSPVFKLPTISETLKAINKNLRGFRYKNDGSTTAREIMTEGKGSDKAMSDLIFIKTREAKIKTKIVRYNTPKGVHDSVIVYNKKWINFPYSGMDPNFKPTRTSLSKTVKVVKKYV